MSTTSTTANTTTSANATTMNIAGKPLAKSKYFWYGANDIANNLVYVTFLTYLMYFCSEVNLMNTAIIGVLSLAARIFDAVNDIWIGNMANNTRTKLGRYRPWILGGIAPTIVTFVLIFTRVPADWSAVAKNWYVGILYIAWTFAFTMIYVPYGSLASVITVKADERGKLGAARIGMGQIANFALSFALVAATAIGGGDMGKGFQGFALLTGIIAAFFWIMNVVNQREVVQPTSENKEEKSEKTSIKAFFKHLPKNVPYICVLVGMFVYGFTLLGRSAAYAYYFQFYVGDMNGLVLFQMFMYAGIGIGCALVPKLLKVLPHKGRLIVFSAIVAGLLYMVTGWMDYNASPALYLAITFISNLANGIFNACMWATATDAMEYGQLKTGFRNEGIMMAGGSFAMKVGMGLGTFFAGVLFNAMGYIPGAETQVASALTAINWMMTFAPGIFMLIAALAYLPYKLDNKTHGEIVKELEERGELKLS